MAARPRTRIGARRRATVMRREAERLGTTSRYLSRRWSEVRSETEKYRKWRERLINRLVKESGLTREEVERLGYAPPRMTARMSEFGSLEEINAYMKALREKRKTFDKTRKQNIEDVRKARQKREEAARVSAKSKTEKQRTKQEKQQTHADMSELTRAQKTLMDRINDAVEMDGQQYQDMMDLISELDDMQISMLRAMDDLQLKLLNSPKLLQDDPEAQDRIDATSNEDRIEYLKKLIAKVR